MEPDLIMQRVKIPGISDSKNVLIRDYEYETWKPNRFDPTLAAMSEDEKTTTLLYRSVTSLLNKLTPQNFSALAEKMKNLPIDTSVKMQRVVEMVHRKAIREKKYRAVYAKLCDELRHLEVVNELLNAKSFSLYLIGACETFFEDSLRQDFRFDRQKHKINMCFSEECKKFLMKDYKQYEDEFRLDSIGNCQFIGELFKVYMIYPKIVFVILDRLFKASGDVAVECICCILVTIGPFYEEKIGQFPAGYFDKLKSLLSKSELCPRTRFFIQDLLDLRNRCWRFKKLPELPKTIQQLNEEIREEERCEKLSESMPYLNYILRKNKAREKCTINFNSEWVDISVPFLKYFRESKKSKDGDQRNHVSVPSNETHSSDESERRAITSSLPSETQSLEEFKKSTQVPISFSADDDDTVCGTIRDLLEKLTFDNLKEFAAKIRELSMSNYSRLKFVADSIYELATNKPELCKLYAAICNIFQNLHVIVDKKTKKINNFRNCILDKCQQEFERSDDTCKQGESDSESNGKLVVNCRFFGELYNAKVFAEIVVIRRIGKLLDSWNEVSSQRLLELLTIVENDLILKLKQLRQKDANDHVIIRKLTQLENKLVALKLGEFLPSRETPSVLTRLEKIIGARRFNEPPTSAKIGAEPSSKSKKILGDHISVPSSETHSSNESEKPAQMPTPINATLPYHDPVCETVREILDELTYDNLEELTKRIVYLSTCNPSKLQFIADLIYEQATKKHENCKLYAEMCGLLWDLQVIVEKRTFKTLIINKCQQGFEDETLKPGESESEFIRRLVLNCRFIGALYNLQTYMETIIFRCIGKLLDSWNKVSGQRLLELLSVIEKNFVLKVKRSHKNDTNESFNQKLTQLKAKVAKLKSGGFPPSPETSTVLKRLDKIINAGHSDESATCSKIDAKITSFKEPYVVSSSMSKQAFYGPPTEAVVQKNENIAPSTTNDLTKKVFNTLKFTLLEWSSTGNIPSSFESSKYKNSISSEKFPESVSELIKYVMTTDRENAEKCGRLFVHLMERGYIHPQSVIEGLGCFLNTVENNEIPIHLELVMSPLFEYGYLKLDDLNAIFQNNSNNKPNENKKKKVKVLESKPVSKELVKKDIPVVHAKANIPVQNPTPFKSFFDPFSRFSTAAPAACISAPFAFPPARDSRAAPAAAVENKDDAKNVLNIKQLIQKTLDKQKRDTYKSSEFRLEMESIPFKKSEELEYAASHIIKMVENYPDSYAFYANLCGPIIMLTAGKMKFWMILMKVCKNHFHQGGFFSLYNSSENDLKKHEKKIGFCRFFARLVNKINNETGRVTTKLILSKFLKMRQIEFFCEVYNGLRWNEAYFEHNLFDCYIPELLSSRETSDESRIMLNAVVEDYAKRKAPSTGKQEQQQPATQPISSVVQANQQQQLGEASTKNCPRRIKIVDPETGEEVSLCNIKQQQTEKTSEKNEGIENLDNKRKKCRSKKKKPKSSDSDFPKDQPESASNCLDSVQNHMTDEALNVSSSDEMTPSISHKKIEDTVMNVLKQLESRPNDFLRLAQTLCRMPIDSKNKMSNTVHLICNRAIKSNLNCQLYVVLCENIHHCHWTIIDKNTQKTISFKSQMIEVLYEKCHQNNLKINRYKENCVVDTEECQFILNRVVGYCRFLCAVLKSPVFCSEVAIFPVIQLLLWDPVDENIVELLNQFLEILRNDLHLKLAILEDEVDSSAVVKSSVVRFETYNVMFKIITLLQDVIKFQKSNDMSNYAEGIETNASEVDFTQRIRIRSKAHNKRLDFHLKTNPHVIDTTIKHFEELSSNPTEFINSIVISMCRSLHEEWKKGDAVKDLNNEFCSYALLFKIFKKNISSFEVHCVNALIEYLKNFKLSPGLMSRMFELLYLYEIISFESFIRFKKLSVSEKISDIVTILNSSMFQDYKLSQNL